jgi:hypothetical protein
MGAILIVIACTGELTAFPDMARGEVPISILKRFYHPFLLETQKAHALTILTEIYPRADLEPNPANKILMSVTGSQAGAQDFVAAQKLRGVLMQHLAFLWRKHPASLSSRRLRPSLDGRLRGQQI